MANQVKSYNALALPLAIERANPIPLDSTSIWYNLEEMQNYAKTDATAYVGQVIVYVDTEKNTSTAYIIANSEGDLEQIGLGDANIDDITLEINDDGKAALKDFGKKYYKWVGTVAAVGKPDEEGYVTAIPGHYEEQEVDETHPWGSGLQLRTVGSSGIGWYEPSTETAEGINDSVAALQDDVKEVRAQIASLTSAFRFKGVLTLEQGQDEESALAAVENPSVGDVYQIGNNEWVYTDSQGWIELGPQLDLSGYVTDSELKAVNMKITELRISDANFTNDLVEVWDKNNQLEASLNELAGNLTQVSGNLDAAIAKLDTRVGNLEQLIGAPAQGDTAASGLYAVMDTFITGAQIDGTDVDILNHKLQLNVFDGGAAGLVPAPSELQAEDYVLSAAGTWVKPRDTRIGDIEDGITVVDYIDKKVADAALTWSTMTE